MKRRILAIMLVLTMLIGVLPGVAMDDLLGSDDGSEPAADVVESVEEPGESTEPETPEEPEAPAEPEQPAESEAPEETEVPEESAEPETPAESEAPEGTEKPAESEAPVEPTVPAETEKPAPVEPKRFDVEEAYAYIQTLVDSDEFAAYMDTLTEEERAELALYISEVEGPFEPEDEFSEAGLILADDFAAPVHHAAPAKSPSRVNATSTGFEGTEMVEPATGLQVNKTAKATDKTDAAGNPIYEIELTAEAESHIVVSNLACDIVLVLDRSGSMDGSNMSSLQKSVNSFLSTVQERSPNSRVAIVSYGPEYRSTVDTGNGSYSDALRPITENNAVNSELTTAIAKLSSRTYGGTYSDEGLEKAARILQAVPSSDPNYGNARVVILFTDGIPGTGSWGGTAYKVAQQSIHWGMVLKAPKGENVALDFAQGFYGSKSDSSIFRGATTGCGATVYCVGLDLPNYDGDSSSGSMINEYLYRVSSHRPDGSHVGYDIQNAWERNWSDWNRKYPDEFTRNRPEGSYYAVGNTSALNGIFTTIAQQTGEAIENTTIRDYITPGFDLCDADGNIYSVGDKIQSGSRTGTVKRDDYGVYVEWEKVDLDPGDANNAGKKSFSEKIYLKPKAGFWGGNQVPTNITGVSGVYDANGNNIGSFPTPDTVDVPVKKPVVQPTTSNIYFGGSVPGIDDLYELDRPTEAWQTAYVVIAATDSVKISNTADGHYNVTVTVRPRLKGSYGPQSETVTSTVNVFQPYAQFADSTIYLGNEADFAVNAPENVTWKHGDTVSDDVNMIGSAPDVKYSYDVEAGAFDDCTEVKPEVQVGGTACGGANVFTVHVLKPAVSVALSDTTAYYGDSYSPAGGSSAVDWRDAAHTEIPTASENKPYASAELKYYSDAAGTSELTGMVMPDQDVKVYVRAFHNGETLTVEQFTTTCAVDGKSCTEHNEGYFTVHPLTCSLVITKTADKLFGEKDSFVFTVTGDNETYPVRVQAVITGEGSTTVVGLPVGSYTVTEEDGWSWRYTAENDGKVTLAAGNADGAVTVENKLTHHRWLSGSSVAVNTWNGHNGIVRSDAAPASKKKGA